MEHENCATKEKQGNNWQSTQHLAQEKRPIVLYVCAQDTVLVRYRRHRIGCGLFLAVILDLSSILNYATVGLLQFRIHISHRGEIMGLVAARGRRAAPAAVHPP